MLVTMPKEKKRLDRNGALKYHSMHDSGGQPRRLGRERMPSLTIEESGAVAPTILESATHLEHFNKGLGDKTDSFVSDTVRGTRVSVSDIRDESKRGQKQR